MGMKVRIYPAQPQGSVQIPPSKSLSHRALLAAALAGGESRIFNMGASKDIEATLRGVERLGARVEQAEGITRVFGNGGKLPGKIGPIHCGESGSTLRFLLPLLASTPETIRLTGEGRLMERPLTVYEELFSSQQIPFCRGKEGILVGGSLRAGKLTVRGDVSSQFITGLLYALPLLQGDSEITILPPFESRSYVELTLGLLKEFGVDASLPDPFRIRVRGGQAYRPAAYTVEGDYSQLAFFAVLGAIRGALCCMGMSEHSEQGDSVIIRLLEESGAGIRRIPDGYHVEAGPLRAKVIDLADCPDLGPILTVLAAYSEGESCIYHAGRLRIKESDRGAAMEQELKKLGVDIACEGDNIYIRGRKPLARPDTCVYAHNDHRIAMSLAVFAACGEQPVLLDGAECVAKSYPGFFEDLKQLGIPVEEIPEADGGAGQ